MTGTPHFNHWRKLSDDGFRSLPSRLQRSHFTGTRHKLTAAARVLNEKLVSSDITPELAAELTLQIEQSPLS